MGLNPTIWGPHGWFFLHSVALNFPDKPTEIDRKNYKRFFESIQYILPCPNCSYHYSKHIEENPIQLDSKETLNRWLVHIHNLVNDIHKKPDVSYEEFLRIYKNKYNPILSTGSSWFYPWVILFIVLLILLCILMYRCG